MRARRRWVPEILAALLILLGRQAAVEVKSSDGRAVQLDVTAGSVLRADS
jgi:hypothetical protein